MEVIDLKKNIPLFISEEVNEKIKYLCKKINNVEWSGILFHKIESDILEEDCKIEVTDILLMDKGSAAYTEYEFNQMYIKYLKNKAEVTGISFKELLKNKCENRISHIHSHVNMNTYFSGTDMSELMDNSVHYNYYLSLIVNNRHDMCAKIAFRGKVNINTNKKIKITLKNKDSQEIVKENEENEVVEKEVLYTINCDIITPQSNIIFDDFFLKAIDEVEENDKKKQELSKKFIPHKNNIYNRHQSHNWKDVPESNFAGIIRDEIEEDDIESIFVKNIPEEKIKYFIGQIINPTEEEFTKEFISLYQIFNIATTYIKDNKITGELAKSVYIKSLLNNNILTAFDKSFNEENGDAWEYFDEICNKASDVLDKNMYSNIEVANILADHLFGLELTELFDSQLEEA